MPGEMKHRYVATITKPNVTDDDGQAVVFDGDIFTLTVPTTIRDREFEFDPTGPSAIRQAISRAVRVERRRCLPDTIIEIVDVKYIGPELAR